MITASNARNKSLTSVTVETEIALINLSILNAVQNNQVQAVIDGNTSVTVNNVVVTGTPLTTDQNYYNVWQNTNIGNLSTGSQNLYSGQMNAVITNFNNLGYTISRRTNNAQYIVWQVSW